MKKIDGKIINGILKKIVKQIGWYDESRYIIADGTGFGYNQAYYQRGNRREQIQKLSSHVRVKVVVGVRGKD